MSHNSPNVTRLWGLNERSIPTGPPKEKKLPPLDSRWDDSIPNQTSLPTPNFDRNGAMGPNKLEAIAPQIPMGPSGLTEEKEIPPLYSQLEMESKTLEIQRLEKLVLSQGLQASEEKEMEKAKIASGFQNTLRFLTSDLKIAQKEAQHCKSMLKKSEEDLLQVNYFNIRMFFGQYLNQVVTPDYS